MKCFLKLLDIELDQEAALVKTKEGRVINPHGHCYQREELSVSAVWEKVWSFQATDLMVGFHACARSCASAI